MVLRSRREISRSIVRFGKGFTLLELLIAILVLAVGLLGLATMQAQGLRSNNSAEQRTEATFLAMDIMDRMRSTMVIDITPDPVTGEFDPPVVNAAFDDVETKKVVGCEGDGCSIVQQDLFAWTTAVQDQLGGGAEGGWAAQVEKQGATDVYLITLMWDDQRTGAAGTGCSGSDADMLCFQTMFQP